MAWNCPRPLRAILFAGTLLLAASPLGQRLQPAYAQGIPGETLAGAAKQRLLAKSLPVLDDGNGSLQRRRLTGVKAPDSLNAVLVMCDFADSLLFGRWEEGSGYPPPRQTEFYYAAHDEVYFSHLMGDVADYFDVVSGGQFSLQVTIIPEVVNLPEPMRFYGDHPDEGEQPVLLATNVVAALEASVAFPDFDTVILVHAGAGEETDTDDGTPEQIYSTYLGPDDFREARDEGVLEYDYIPAVGYPEGEGIRHVLVLPETEYQDPVPEINFRGFYGSLGVYCFEIGLRLGMISLSDFTPAGRVDSQGIGNFGLMGYGLYAYNGWFPPHPCAFNKLLMGWLEPETITAEAPPGQWLYPVHLVDHERTALRVELSGEEYWLLEYRQQDPNGDGFLSWEDDQNQNFWPDFYDASAPGGLPSLDAIFDPEDGDIHETLAGAEWDFYMSDNFARAQGVVAAGSGVYIWHVDEGVIRDCFTAPTNLFNSDPLRKAVDLEEADGIQDLDSSEVSNFMYGGDDDSFRGEDNSEFTPVTRPSTESAGGAWTGISLAGFSNVVADSTGTLLWVDNSVSPPDSVWGIAYADSIAFTFGGPASASGAPRLRVSRTFATGVNLQGSHVLLVDLDGDGQVLEIVLTGDRGEVFVLDGDLKDFLDRGGEPFAVGLRDNLPVQWFPPAAAGDLDADGEPEIVLTSDQGLYAFNGDGSAVRDLGPADHGLYADLTGCALPPVMVGALTDAGYYGPDVPARACVVTTTDGGVSLQLFCGDDGLPCLEFPLGPVLVPAPPVRVNLVSHVVLALGVIDQLTATPRLVVCENIATGGDPADAMTTVPLALTPGPFPVLVGEMDLGPERPWLMAVGAGGRGETVFPLLEGGGTFADGRLWSDQIAVRSAPAPGGAFLVEGMFGRSGPNGEWLTGWPRRPQSPVRAADPAVAPAALPLSPAAGAFLFTARDGRIYRYSAGGEPAAGWPLAGPARVAGTPAIGRVKPDGSCDLVAIGAFPRITGVTTEGEELESEWLSTVTIWADVAAAEPDWPMYGGDPWRSDWLDKVSGRDPAASGATSGLVPGSFICYPSPLKTGPLFVRAEVAAQSRARAFIYNLEGEAITSTEWQEVSPIGSFAFQIDLESVASGLYLCRLVIHSSTAGVEEHVTQFAVVH